MIKVFALLTKKPELSDEQFLYHWRDVHAPLLQQSSRVKRYVQSQVLAKPFPGFSTDLSYSGVAEVWFEDLDAVRAHLNSPEYRDSIQPDEANFIDTAGPTFVFTEENIVIPGPPIEKETPVLKAIFFVKHKKSREHFQDYWRNSHAPLVIGTPDLQRYVQCHVQSEADELGQAAYDGVGELWFADEAAYERCWSSPEIQVEQLPDTLNFVGRGAIGFFVEETRIIWP